MSRYFRVKNGIKTTEFANDIFNCETDKNAGLKTTQRWVK